MAKKIGVIGAGCSGLTAIKCCLDEKLEPICFEKNHEIGGLWRYEKREKVFNTTVRNSSKETLAYSDFPIPKEYPNFMHHTQVMEYFNSYADRFNLRQHIRLHSEVLSCRPTDDFESTGKWKLVIRNTKTEEKKTHVFNGIMICVGNDVEPYYPIEKFAGQENFAGIKMHSSSYRQPTPFTDKRVTIVGIGNSGCDIAGELSRNCKKVFLSTRRGTWIFHRIVDNSIPFDLIRITRLKSWFNKTMPTLMNRILESQLNARFKHEKYGLKPKHRVLSQHPTINDALSDRIQNGTIELKKKITKFMESEIVFADGSKEKIDAVIFATGFSFKFPFLEKGILNITKHESNLFRFVWPMNMKRNTLAVIGLVQPLGVVGPYSEIQSRWVARVLKGSCKLPSQEKMKQTYNEAMQSLNKRYFEDHRHTIKVDSVTYMDSIAEEIGCKPNLKKMAIIDPLLAWQVIKGPFTCVQYRLNGPGKWKDARETIMTQWDRVWYPMKRKEMTCDSSSHLKLYFASFVVFLVFVLLGYIFY